MGFPKINEKAFILMQSEARTGHVLKKDLSPYNFKEDSEVLFTVCDSLEDAKKKARDMVNSNPSVEVNILNSHEEVIAVVRDEMFLKKTKSFSTPKIGNYRWRIVALLFFATTISYIDAYILSFIRTDLQFKREMLDIAGNTPLTDAADARFKEMMGYIDAAFRLAYGLGFLFTGWLIDKIGTRKGFIFSMVTASIATIANALVSSFHGLSAVRLMLGLGESGNDPSAIKAVSEWFPKKERAFATAIAFMGINAGIILTFLLIPSIIQNSHWRLALVAIGLLGFILVLFWQKYYRKPEEVYDISTLELQHIKSDKDEQRHNEKISWLGLLGYRKTWAILAIKFFTDPVWWFYLLWLPDFFTSKKNGQLPAGNFGVLLPIIVIFSFSALGSVFFGWFTSKMITNGWTSTKSRKITLGICALIAASVAFIPFVHDYYLIISIIALAVAAHQGWSLNTNSIIIDIFPKSSIASVAGLSGMTGTIGGVIVAVASGKIIGTVGYVPIFITAAFTYTFAFMISHFLAPRFEHIK